MTRARWRWVVPALVAALGAGAVVARPSRPSTADVTAVAVLAHHLDHEANLADAAVVRLPDPGAHAAAADVAGRAAAGAASLSSLLRRGGVTVARTRALWLAATRVSPTPAAGSFGPLEASDSGPVDTHYACSLTGPLDDIDQVRAADPADVAVSFAGLEVTLLLEAEQLTATAHRAPTTAGVRRAMEAVARSQHAALLRLVPFLPPTDRSLADGG